MLSKSFFWKRVAREAENGVEHKFMSSPASNLKRLCGLSAVGCRLSAVGCRLSAVGLILLLGLGLFAFFKIKKTVPAQSVSGSGKELMLSPQVQHLGKINQHEAKEFSFTLTNTSQETIEVEKISQSCGCTQARVDQSQLKPGESTMLRGSLTAQDRVGEFGSVIQVSLSNGTVAKVQVGAKAVNLVNLPSHLDLGETVLGQEPKAVAFEVTKGDSKVEWDGLRVEAGSLKAEVRTLGQDKWQVSVTAPNGEAIGSSRENLTFELLNSRNPGTAVRQETLSTSWKTVSENFSISPSSVYLSRDRVAKVRIKSLRERPFDISHINIPQDVPIQIKQVREGGWHHLELQIFQIRSNLTNQDAKSGKIQVTLYDGLAEENARILILK
jgi:hypothetical protein